jgi:hypothetical protein
MPCLSAVTLQQTIATSMLKLALPTSMLFKGRKISKDHWDITLFASIHNTWSLNNLFCIYRQNFINIPRNIIINKTAHIRLRVRGFQWYDVTHVQILCCIKYKFLELEHELKGKNNQWSFHKTRREGTDAWRPFNRLWRRLSRDWRVQTPTYPIKVDYHVV